MTTRQNPSNATFTPSLADDLTSEMQDWLKTQTDMAVQQQEILKLLAGKSEAFERYGLKNDPMNLQNSVIQYWLHIAQDPEKAVKAQADLWQGYMDLCTQTTQHLQSSKVKPFTPTSEEKPDRRFRDSRWTTDPLFNHLRCAYLLMSNWMNKQADEIEKNDPQSARKMRFALRQYTDALSPSNFWMTNPEILDETMKTRGKNLQKGLSNLIHDLKSSKTLPKVSMVKENVFEVGRNLATTKGSVVFENDFLQLIQYEATTTKVYQTPLLILAPWINKYYILDLQAENSFVGWAVAQGHTVFITSWKNATAEDCNKDWYDYIESGLVASMKAIQKITAEKEINVIGYCIGGTLLTTALAYWQETKQKSDVKSATFFTTLIDFKDSGELSIFTDEPQINAIESMMNKNGYLDAWHTHVSFNMLRSNDLIWSFVVNNYLLGKEATQFDLLFWNSDSTRIPAKLHSTYLRQTYMSNNLAQGKMVINKKTLDVTKINTPSYFISAIEDHIAPWQATYDGATLFNGDVTFTLSGSGHIAGIVNPPAKNKYGYWTNDKLPKQADKWLEKAKKNEGSWWPHWAQWLTNYAGKKVAARKIKNPIEAAPGRYVKVRAL